MTIKLDRSSGTLLTIALSLSLVGCGSSGSPSATAGQASAQTPSSSEAAPSKAARTVDDVCADAAGTTVDYYGSGDPPDQAQINDAFKAEYPEIGVNFINSKTNESVTKVMTEAQAGRAPEVDIVTGNMADQLALYQAGLVADLPLKDLGLQATKVYDVEGVEAVRLKRKFGGLMYNSDTTNPADLPDTWQGLLTSDLRGKFMDDPRGVYLAGLRLAWSQDEYESFIKGLVDKLDPVLVGNTTPQIQKVLTGEFVTGDAGQNSDILQQAAEGAPIAIKYLDVVTTFDIFGTVLNAAADKDAAVCYLNWLNGPAGLKMLAEVEKKANDDAPTAGLPAGAVIAEAANTDELSVYAEAAQFASQALEGQTNPQ